MFCHEQLNCSEPNKVFGGPAPSKHCGQRLRYARLQVNHVAVASERMGDGNIWEAVPEGALALDELPAVVVACTDFGDPEESPARRWMMERDVGERRTLPDGKQHRRDEGFTLGGRYLKHWHLSRPHIRT